MNNIIIENFHFKFVEKLKHCKNNIYVLINICQRLLSFMLQLNKILLLLFCYFIEVVTCIGIITELLI